MNGLKRFFKKSSWRCSWKGAAFALLLGMSMEAEAQISFSCFEANSYFSYDINILRQNFTLEGEKEAKYVEVVWYAFVEIVCCEGMFILFFVLIRCKSTDEVYFMQ